MASSTSAPERSRMLVKVAASMRPGRRARRQRSELAANPTSAAAVQAKVTAAGRPLTRADPGRDSAWAGVYITSHVFANPSSHIGWKRMVLLGDALGRSFVRMVSLPRTSRLAAVLADAHLP